MIIDNPILDKQVFIIFGKERAERLKEQVKKLSPYEREKLILKKLFEALNDIGGNYSINYRFTDDSGKKTSHHLIFTSKNVLGYKIMKEIMANASSSFEQDVPSYTYSPYPQSEIQSLFPKIDELKSSLSKTYKGKTITCKELIEEHNIGKPFVAKNYKKVLKALESEGTIIANPSKEKRRKDTFGDNVKITFK